jgi:hypothetical protein
VPLARYPYPVGFQVQELVDKNVVRAVAGPYINGGWIFTALPLSPNEMDEVPPAAIEIFRFGVVEMNRIW